MHWYHMEIFYCYFKYYIMPRMFVGILSEEALCQADESTASEKRVLCCALKEPRLTVVLEYDFISMGMNMVPTILPRIS